MEIVDIVFHINKSQIDVKIDKTIFIDTHTHTVSITVSQKPIRPQMLLRNISIVESLLRSITRLQLIREPKWFVNFTLESRYNLFIVCK